MVMLLGLEIAAIPLLAAVLPIAIAGALGGAWSGCMDTALSCALLGGLAGQLILAAWLLLRRLFRVVGSILNRLRPTRLLLLTIRSEASCPLKSQPILVSSPPPRLI